MQRTLNGEREQAMKMVIRGHIQASDSFDAILVGYYEGKDLRYAAQVRTG